MDIQKIKQGIQTRQLPNFLIFTGPEWKVMDIYIHQIADKFDLRLEYVDSVLDIRSALRTRSFLSVNKCYVVRDDSYLVKEDADSIISLLGDNKLILLLTVLDKRTKFYKKYKNEIVEFATLSETTLKKYISKEITLSDANCKRLISYCENNYGSILLQLDKLRHYSSISGIVNMDDCFSILVKEGAIYQPPKDAVFDFVDAVLDHNVKLSYELFDHCIRVGEATLVMLSVLYTNVRAVLQVQTAKSNDIAKSTGLTNWQILNAKKHMGVYSTEFLMSVLKLIQKTEKGIKTGRIEESVAIPYILSRVL